MSEEQYDRFAATHFSFRAQHHQMLCNSDGVDDGKWHIDTIITTTINVAEQMNVASLR